MIEVIENVYVGNDADVEEFKDMHLNGVIIHAAKEPYHRQFVGYTGRGAPKDDPEYLAAIRDNELALNLVDSPKPEFIPKECFEEAFDFFEQEHLIDGRPILIHCNQGKSRSHGVLLYCLFKSGYFDDTGNSIDDMLTHHEDELGAEFGDGVRGALENWL